MAIGYGTAFITPINTTGTANNTWGYAQTTSSGTPGTYPKCDNKNCTTCYPDATADGISDPIERRLVIREHQIVLLKEEIKRLKEKEQDVENLFRGIEMVKDTCKNCRALIKIKK